MLIFDFLRLCSPGVAAYRNFSDSKARQRLKRQAFFWSRMLPVYYHYRMVEFYLHLKNVQGADRNEYFDPLHDRYAPKTLEVIRHLRGFYIKIGQVASVRADAFPNQYLKELSSLQDAVPAVEWETMKEILENDLQTSIDNVFQHIDRHPIGAASIGQVHKAILKDGTPVAVKIMYPEVEEMFHVQDIFKSYHSI